MPRELENSIGRNVERATLPIADIADFRRCERKAGSVGSPFRTRPCAYLNSRTTARSKECAPGEDGEICVASPGAFVGNPTVDPVKNKHLYADADWLRIGDFGILNEEGYF